VISVDPNPPLADEINDKTGVLGVSIDPEPLQNLRKSFGKPKGARKVAMQGVGAGLFASVGCRSAMKLWCLSGVHRIAKLSLRNCLKSPIRARMEALQAYLNEPRSPISPSHRGRKRGPSDAPTPFRTVSLGSSVHIRGKPSAGHNLSLGCPGSHGQKQGKAVEGLKAI
jgi:hypothetical protein